MHVLKFLAGMTLLLMISSGCATVLRGDQQKVAFKTDPSPATVTVDGRTYTSPAEVTLKRKEPHTVTVSAPGYQPLRFEYLAVWDGASLPNIAAPGGSAMFAADTATGADKSFHPLEVIKLEKSSAPTTQPTMLFEHRGKLMTKDDFDHVLTDERNYRDAANSQ
jgi:hypothetical protein